MAETIRISATLSEDAVAHGEPKKFVITLSLKVGTQKGSHKVDAEFIYPGEGKIHPGEFLAPLKKDRVLELIATLEESRLVATHVRIERADHKIKSHVTLLPHRC